MLIVFVELSCSHVLVLSGWTILIFTSTLLATSNEKVSPCDLAIYSFLLSSIDGVSPAWKILIVSDNAPSPIIILPSLFSSFSFFETANVRADVLMAFVLTYLIHSLESSAILYVTSIFALTSMFISLPSAGTSNVEAVTVSASFCFCVTFIVLLVEPALMITDAERSSGSVFSFVVIVIVAFPALPLVGDTLHQESARTFTAEAVQDVETLKVMLIPPYGWYYRIKICT